MATQYHVNPRFRAYGRARLEIARQATTREEWNTLWKPPQNTFPFTWGRHWKHCVEYRVDDYAAEAGFFIDVLGFPVNAFDPQYAQFTGPDGEFFIAFMPASEESSATPPDSLRLQFMVANLPETTTELDRRGVAFDQPPQPLGPGSNLLVASFRTPHGIQVDLWGEAVPVPTQKAPAVQPTKQKADDKAQVESSPLRRAVQVTPAPKPPVRRPVENKTQVAVKPRMTEDRERSTTTDDIPQVEHFFPVRAPGQKKPVRKNLEIRLAEPRPLLQRDPA